MMLQLAAAHGASGRFRPTRERLAEHRENAPCSGCNRLTDPLGFTLENYDAVGRWRISEGGSPVDTSGSL